jgi:single-stranded DNA-binding protein
MVLTSRLHLSKGQLVDVEGRLQTRQWDDDDGVRQCVTLLLLWPGGHSNPIGSNGGSNRGGYPRSSAPADRLL